MVVMLYQWIVPDKVDPNVISHISQEFHLHPLIATVLYNRNIRSDSQIYHFFNDTLDDLFDPFLLDNMDIAVERIISALQSGEKIMIYGDYDVDGVTSVSILYDSLFRLGGKVMFYIPDRFDDGYGLSEAGIKKAAARDASLIVTVDCGTTAINEVEYARNLGIETIICDHHEQGDHLPDAVAILNPKLKGSNYPFRELAGCGVAFKLLQALLQKLGYDKSWAYQYLDLVAIGTAADIVNLTSENRIFVKYGLKQVNQSPREGVYALMEQSGLLNRHLNVNSIVFNLAPRINAVGRISKAKKAVHLLTTTSFQQGRNIAQILEKENNTRRGIDEVTFKEAEEIISESVDLDNVNIIVLSKKDWHMGVLGIVASRLVEKYKRPVILISVIDHVGKGSARSVRDVNILSHIKLAESLLTTYGGHQYAAGLTIAEEQIEEFKKRLIHSAKSEAVLDEIKPKLYIDSEVMLEQFNADFFKSLKQLEPFGPDNMRPVFTTYGLELFGRLEIVGNNHLKTKFKQNGVVLDAIGYNFGDYINHFNHGKKNISLSYVIEENNWNGRTTVQMRIKDFEVTE
jgi:single-stranded-DNA-specific exonuclease